ncbi:hypothetical protein [Aggregatibacter actinomycetemcomitans]|uniref:hypothetical protein n=1 Tax=Aggregatibacter actinomycetemcomitans TaxID=714 RepID=UPI00197C20C6|nr:hypothetical protein [Aggregatibacter actinomycetemcomitans]MBN6064745.1 hypothetical protein [Aggregatibacter actinomycetemcomitans]MBN6081881.1 hypothetical protein [Aggregatibacter actinomycetemcomitans]MBN6084171.1 hypothetical protein [Aggregatibacter actinomycetemcomitans]
MTLFSENSEKDYISLYQLIQNFNSSGNNKLDVKDIIKLLLNEKIRFFVYVSGDQNKIKLSKREDASYFKKETFKLYIGDFKDSLGRKCKGKGIYSSDDEYNYKIKSPLVVINNQSINFSGYLEKSYIEKSNRYFINPIIARWEEDDKDEASNTFYILGKEMNFSGFFELVYNFDLIDDLTPFEEAFWENAHLDQEMPLITRELHNRSIELSIDNINGPDFDLGPTHSLWINYSRDLYLSRAEFERLSRELNLLKPLDLTPQNNEIEKLKKEIDELKEQNRTLNLKNKRLERELDKLKNGELLNSDKHYQNLIIGLIYQLHPDYKGRKGKFFKKDRSLNRNGIVESVIDTLEDLKSKNVFTEEIFKDTTLDGKLKLTFKDINQKN